MNEPLRLLVAISGGEDPVLVDEVTRLVGPAPRPVQITLVHVVDIEPRALLGHGPAVRRGPWPSRPGGPEEHRLEDAVRIDEEIRRGRPEHEIIAAAQLTGPQQ